MSLEETREVGSLTLSSCYKITLHLPSGTALLKNRMENLYQVFKYCTFQARKFIDYLEYESRWLLRNSLYLSFNLINLWGSSLGPITWSGQVLHSQTRSLKLRRLFKIHAEKKKVSLRLGLGNESRWLVFLWSDKIVLLDIHCCLFGYWGSYFSVFCVFDFCSE